MDEFWIRIDQFTQEFMIAPTFDEFIDYTNPCATPHAENGTIHMTSFFKKYGTLDYRKLVEDGVITIDYDNLTYFYLVPSK